MKNINLKKTIAELTVEEFLEIQGFNNSKKQYTHGLKGIAKVFGCSKSKAFDIKNSGIIDDAIYQNKNIIIVDIEKALELFNKNK